MRRIVPRKTKATFRDANAKGLFREYGKAKQRHSRQRLALTADAAAAIVPLKPS
jgi:hypothetical protein